MSSRKSRSDPPNHLSHLTWLVISSHLRRRDEPISAARATWALAAARDMASRAGRSPLVSPKSVAPAAAGCRAAARRKSALRSPSQIAERSKSKKKVVYVPGPHGPPLGGTPQAIAALTVLYTTRSKKSLFGPPAICQCGRTKAPFWLGSSPSRRASEQC